MDDTEVVAALAPPAVLRPWFAEHVPDARDAALTVRAIGGGRSNEVFEVRQGERRWTLRRPAAAALERADEGMRREFRVLRALAGTDVPHPAAIAFCDDPTVIGSVFYVMDHLDGFVPVDPLPSPFSEDPAARRELAFAVVDALVALHGVDWRAVGLEGFGRPDGFLERQVKRWRTQLDSYRTRAIPLLADVESWLEANTPAPQEPTIMHGDYHLGNLIAAHDLPPRLIGIVDWENATIGDPLLDVAYLLASWPDPDDAESLASARIALVDGVPTRAEMAARYERRSGRSLSDLTFYATLSQYKLACMLEGIYARQRATGLADNQQLGDYVVALIERSHRRLRSR